MQDPRELIEALRTMSSDELHHVAEAVRQVQIERAIGAGDHDAIIARAFEIGFGRDGLGVLPWVDGEVIVCPGALVARSRTNHRCRFVSVDDVWVWDSGLLLREDKRSAPGVEDGFRAIALLPVVDGTELDRARSVDRSHGRTRGLARGPRGRPGRGRPARRGHQEHALRGRSASPSLRGSAGAASPSSSTPPGSTRWVVDTDDDVEE